MNRRKYLWWGLWLVVIGMVFLTYSNHFNNPFHFDDAHTIVNNKALLSLKNIPSFFEDARTFSTLPANQSYRPGLTTLNAIDVWLGGQHKPIPFYFHCSIFASFLAMGILLYFFLLSMFNAVFKGSLNKYIAFFGTAWFWLHTANAETVNYIIAREDLFSAFMVVLAFVIYVYKPSWRKTYLYLVPMLIGFSVKEPAIMFAPLLVVYIWLFEKDMPLSAAFKKENIPTLITTIITTLPAFVLGIALFVFSRFMTPPTWTPGGTDRFHYLLTQPFVLVHYFDNFILPFNLSADTDWKLVHSVINDRTLAGMAFVISMLWIAFRTSRKKETRPVTFGILWFFIAVLPTSSIIPLSEVLSDHRAFMPYVGLFIAFTWAGGILVYKYKNVLAEKQSYKISLIMALSLFLLAHAYGTHQRNKVWSSGVSLWKDVTVKSPGNARGWMNYGSAIMAKGNYDEAEKCFDKTISMWPHYSYAYINMAVLKSATNHPQEAEYNFKLGLKYGYDNPEAYYYYARFLLQHKRIAEAKKLVAAGLTISPEHEGLLALSKTLQNYNTGNAKLTAALDAVKANPTAGNYLDLSLQYYLVEDYQKCIEAAYNALKIKPDYDLAYNNICSAYNEMKEWDKAIAAGKKGLKINPNNERLKNNLQVAMAGKAREHK